ncbi:MAG: hypothetical protein AB8H79_18515 [Myxococcota bacterium]
MHRDGVVVSAQDVHRGPDVVDTLEGIEFEGVCLDYRIQPDGGTATLELLGMPDQYGDLVDLYDCIGRDRPIIVVAVGASPESDRAVGEWLAGHSAPEWTRWYGEQPWFDGLAERIRRQEAQWITVLVDHTNDGHPSQSDAAEWAAAYPVPGRAVLADSDGTYRAYRRPGRSNVAERTDAELVVWEYSDDIAGSLQALYAELSQ